MSSSVILLIYICSISFLVLLTCFLLLFSVFTPPQESGVLIHKILVWDQFPGETRLRKYFYLYEAKIQLNMCVCEYNIYKSVVKSGDTDLNKTTLIQISTLSFKSCVTPPEASVYLYEILIIPFLIIVLRIFRWLYLRHLENWMQYNKILATFIFLFYCHYIIIVLERSLSRCSLPIQR